MVSLEDGEPHKQSFPPSGEILDLDQLLEKQLSGGGGGHWPEREARDRDSRPLSPSGYDQAMPKRSVRDLEDRSRSDKPVYYDPLPPDGRSGMDQPRSYGSAKDRSTRPVDWDDRRDRDRR